MERKVEELICGNCKHCRKVVIWFSEYACEISGWPINKDNPVCVSYEEKKSAHRNQKNKYSLQADEPCGIRV